MALYSESPSRRAKCHVQNISEALNEPGLRVAISEVNEASLLHGFAAISFLITDIHSEGEKTERGDGITLMWGELFFCSP